MRTHHERAKATERHIFIYSHNVYLFILCPCCCSSLLNTRTWGWWWWYATTIQIIILILRSWCAPTFALIFYATIPCPLSCVGGRWRVLLPVTHHSWWCCMARVISKQILNNSWAGSGPMTPSCATYSVMLSEYIHIYVQCVSPSKN